MIEVWFPAAQHCRHIPIHSLKVPLTKEHPFDAGACHFYPNHRLLVEHYFGIMVASH